MLSHSSPLRPDQPHSHMCIKMIIQGGRRFAEESALAGAQEDLMKFQTNSEHKMIFRETQNKNNIWKYR